MTLEVASAHLAVSLRTLQRMIARGDIAAYRIGRIVRVNLHELLNAARVQVHEKVERPNVPAPTLAPRAQQAKTGKVPTTVAGLRALNGARP